MKSEKVNYFFVFVDKSKQAERKKVMQKYVTNLINSKLVNRKYSISVTNKIHYDINLKVPEDFDPLGSWDITFLTDIPDDADPIQLMIAFHELVINPLPEYKNKVQIGGGSETLKETRILSKEEIKANRLTKEQRKELRTKYYNKRPMKKFIENMGLLFDERIKKAEDLNP